MKLDDEQESPNVENRRGQGGGGMGGLGGLPVSGGHLGFGSIILLIIFAVLFRVNPLELLRGGQMVAPDQTTSSAADSTDVRPIDSFVKKILHSTETVWGKHFSDGSLSSYASVSSYTQPKLVLFAGSIQTACGGATAAVGPFYCPGDAKVYLDTDFFDELSQKFGAPGQFAEGYVIAHEVGHHVQNLLGISQKADEARQTMSKKQYNLFSVKLELQADCFAGVWGHDEQEMGKLNPDDIDEALNAATAIGDDKLQKSAQGYAVPDSFTHGTSEQRVRWFKRGFDSGDVKQCDTLHAPAL